MAEKVPFEAKELEQRGEYSAMGGLFTCPLLSSPITMKENFHRFLKNDHPLWMPSAPEFKMFNPRLIPDNVARSIVGEAEPFKQPENIFNKDIFGVEWEYVPKVGGSMVRPGKPFLNEVSEWESKVVFPDLSKLDWEGCVEKNKEYLSEERAYRTTVFTGFFERLISFVDMTPALLAMIDEDEADDVKALFDRLADFYCEMFEYFAKYFKMDFIWFHDDWGSQRAPLFSCETAKEMVVPALRKVVDKAHALGMGFEFHCCGKDELLVPAMIEAGCDMWAGQPMNDFEYMYKEFGKDIKLGVDMPQLPENPTDQIIRDNVNQFLDKFPENVYVGMSAYSNQDYYKALYEESRKRFNA